MEAISGMDSIKTISSLKPNYVKTLELKSLFAF